MKRAHCAIQHWTGEERRVFQTFVVLTACNSLTILPFQHKLGDTTLVVPSSRVSFSVILRLKEKETALTRNDTY